ncbi:MAG TPA: hypothetical protein VF472_07145 [Burkholderiaceae bacterium]
MKINAHPYSRLRDICVLISFLITTSCPKTAAAQENSPNIKLINAISANQNGGSSISIVRELSDLKNAKSVALFFEFPHAEHYAGLDESQLQKLGCSFSANTKEKILDMVEIIKASRPKKAKSKDGEDYLHVAIDVREEVLFEMMNGEERKFLFSGPLSSSNNLAGYFDTQKIVTSPNIVTALYRWGAHADYNETFAKSTQASQETASLKAQANIADELKKGCVEFTKQQLAK